jgi:hypothetical protein
MYLTAQRVISPVTGAEGVNVFAYGHGPYVWHDAPPFTPEQNPGTLFASSVEPQVPPPGNRVRSYLDILAPDATPREALEVALQVVVTGMPPARLPATATVGSCWFRFSMEEKLAGSWREELRALLARAVQLLPAPEGSRMGA